MNKDCSFASNNLVLDSDHTYAPCCRFKKFKGFPRPHASELTFMEAFSHPTFQKVRDELSSGKFPDPCSTCQHEEASGVESLRGLLKKGLGKNFIPDRLQALEIFVGSLCNMKCRMCHSLASSKWAEELNESTNSAPDIPKILKNLDGKELRSIRFLGGEPLINQKFFEILQWLREHVDRGQVSISLSTNGSVGPNSKILQYFDWFDTIELLFSIDGIGSVGEYIRHGIPWRKIERSIDQWVGERIRGRGLLLNAHTTLQATNYADVHNIILFCIDRGLQFWSHRTLEFPAEFRINRLSQSYREKVAINIQNHRRYLEIESFLKNNSKSGTLEYLVGHIPNMPESPISDFIKELEIFDRRWGVRWQAVIPGAIDHPEQAQEALS